MEMGPVAPRSADLVDGLRRRDAGAVAELRELVSQRLRSALRFRGVSEADLDDFAQDAAIRVLDRLDTYRGDASFSTWVAVVAVRSALTALRRRSGRVEQPLANVSALESPALPERPVDQVLTQELRACLLTAVARELTERQREVIMSELNGVPQICIAERLGMSTGAVYKMSHDARKKLRSALIRDGFIPDHDAGASTPKPRRAP